MTRAVKSYSPAIAVLTQYAPAFHGFYRAIVSSPFAWAPAEWIQLVDNLSTLFSPDVVDHLNNLLSESLQMTENDPEEAHFIHVFLSRYVNQDRPLSGYFIVCCVMEIVWTVLAQTLSPPPPSEPSTTQPTPLEEEAAAANRVWKRLMRKAVAGPEGLASSQEKLEKVSAYAMRCFTDLLVQIESMDAEPSLDTYTWETMSESLVSLRLALQHLSHLLPRALETSHRLLHRTARHE